MDNIKNTLKRFEQLEWTKQEEGLKTKELVFDNKLYRMLSFTETFTEKDWCSNEHNGVVVKGKLNVEFVNGIKTYSQNDEIVINHNEKHKAFTNKGENAIVLLSENKK